MSVLNNADMLRGFKDPVADAGHMFRAVLDAMAHPGRVVDVVAPAEHPSAISAATSAVLLTLCDYATPVWLAPSVRKTDVDKFIRFHSGAPIVEDPSQAAFAVLSGRGEMLQFDRFSVGTPEYPDRSATIIIDVVGFDAGERLRLRGPGIDGTAELGVSGAPNGLWEVLDENAKMFPLGIDTVLAGPQSLASLPRTTAIEVL